MAMVSSSARPRDWAITVFIQCPEKSSGYGRGGKDLAGVAANVALTVASQTLNILSLYLLLQKSKLPVSRSFRLCHVQTWCGPVPLGGVLVFIYLGFYVAFNTV